MPRPVSVVTVAVLAGSITLATPGVLSASAAASDPIVGDWNVTYGAPAVVTMSLSGGVYTETAKTPVRVTVGSCVLPAGTSIATFSSTGPNTYSGQHGLWDVSTCAFAFSTSLSLTLSSDGRTLTGPLGSGGDVTFTRALTAQSITFAPLANKTRGDPDFTVIATASSGLPVAFAAGGACSVSGSTVHLTGVGICTITASQAGDSTYGSAPAVSQTFSIAEPRLPAAFGANGVFALPSNRACVSRRNFRIRIRRQRAGVTLVSAAVAVNGRRVAVRRGARLTAPVDLRGLPKGRFTVRISALTADGRAIVGTRRYRTCAPKQTSGGHGPLVLAATA
jgi:hypothetical protein